ncbi:hypothetical protein DBB_28280 [Desulfoluna spongiiphila]|nr:hypothetical protein DBB_28280 [Desulfoluna spongiiphila]
MEIRSDSPVEEAMEGLDRRQEFDGTGARGIARARPGAGQASEPLKKACRHGAAYTAEEVELSSSFIFLIFSTRVVRFMLRSSAALAFTQLDSFRA